MFPVGKQILEGVLVRDITAKANIDKRSGLMRETPLLSMVKMMKLKKMVKILLILWQFGKRDWGEQDFKRGKKYVTRQFGL